MTNYAVRMAVAAMYDAPAWKARVSRMPDRQVYAIYKRSQQGKKTTTQTPIPSPSYRQLTLWDIQEASNDNNN